MIPATAQDEILPRPVFVREMSAFNSVSNTLTSGWCNYWLKWNLYDLQCGFRCYKTESLQKILDYGLTRKKFDFETLTLTFTPTSTVEDVDDSYRQGDSVDSSIIFNNDGSSEDDEEFDVTIVLIIAIVILIVFVLIAFFLKKRK